MKEKDFDTFCAALSKACNVDQNALVKQGRALVDGVEICVVFNEKTDPDRIHCYADMGHPNHALRADIYEEILKSQLFLANQYNAVFGIDPISGNCVLASAIPAKTAPDVTAVKERFHVYALQSKAMADLMANGPAARPAATAPHGVHPAAAAVPAKPHVATPAGAGAPVAAAHTPKH